MNIQEILSHFKSVFGALALSDDDREQFHAEQQCRIGFAGLKPIIRYFL